MANLKVQNILAKRKNLKALFSSFAKNKEEIAPLRRGMAKTYRQPTGRVRQAQSSPAHVGQALFAMPKPLQTSEGGANTGRMAMNGDFLRFAQELFSALVINSNNERRFII